MAAPSYATDLTDITLAETTTNWSAFGGGASGLSASPDLAVQGTNCVDKQVTNADKGMLYNNGATSLGIGDHIYVWLFCGTPGLIDTYANNGLYVGVGTGTGAFTKFHMTGSDQFTLDETVKCWVVEYATTANGSAPQRTLVGTPGGTPSHFGGGLNTTASVKGANLGLDAIRYGFLVEVYDGDSGTPATWDDFASYAHDSTRRWGIIQPTGTGASIQGKVAWGRTGNSVYARDSDRVITFLDNEHAAATLNQIEFEHASTDVVFDNIGIVSLGTNSPGSINIVSGDVTWTNSVFQNIGFSDLRGNAVFDGTTWISSDWVRYLSGSGGSFLGASIITPTVAVDSYAFRWDVNVDTDGYLDGMTFEMGANDHHAIYLTANTPSEITLRDWTVTGFSASNNVNSSVIHNTSGKAITVNVVGNSGTISYKDTGAGSATTIVANPVTTTVTVQDIRDGSPIENARVYLNSGTNHLLQDAASELVSTTDKAALDLTDSLEFIACIACDDYTEATNGNDLFGKRNGTFAGDAYWGIIGTDGALLVAGSDGSAYYNLSTPVSLQTESGVADGDPIWIRMVYEPNYDPGVQSRAWFYYSFDSPNTGRNDVTWTGFASNPQTSSSTYTFNNSSTDLAFGDDITTGTAANFRGKIHGMWLIDNGTVVAATDWRSGDLTSDGIGNTWTKSGATYVDETFLDQLTNASGVVTDSRTLATDLPISGWVRRASSGFGTLYKQGAVAGTIDSSNGLSITVQLIPDE